MAELRILIDCAIGENWEMPAHITKTTNWFVMTFRCPFLITSLAFNIGSVLCPVPIVN
jgi:hypothetical protein